jgi:hypothetical protein
LLLLLAATTERDVIDETVAKAVVALLQYQLEVRRECDPVDAENSIARLEERIRRALARGPLSGPDLKRAVHYSRSGLWAFGTAIENLMSAGEVLFDTRAGLYFLAAQPEPREACTTSCTTPKSEHFAGNGEEFHNRGGVSPSWDSGVTPTPTPEKASKASTDKGLSGSPDSGADSGAAPPAPTPIHSEACDCSACLAAVTTAEDWS